MAWDSLLSVLIYCALIVASSLAGGWLPTIFTLTHTRMQVIVSFVGGLMLGVSLFHMLPHATIYANSLDRVMWWTVIGLLTMFFLIRVFHFHQHGTAETSHDQGDDDAGGDTHDPRERMGHAHEHPLEGHVGHRLSWIGVAVGLAIHTLIDGVALGAAVVSESGHDRAVPGFSIFLVILLHKPLDALSITSLMAAGGWSGRWRQTVNAAFALMCPLGALLFVAGVGAHQHALVGCALAFSAGVFLCISLGDLLPEVHFHRHDRLKLSTALLLGIAAAYAVGMLEPHNHGLHIPEEPSSHSHDSHSH